MGASPSNAEIYRAVLRGEAQNKYIIDKVDMLHKKVDNIATTVAVQGTKIQHQGDELKNINNRSWALFTGTALAVISAFVAFFIKR